MKIISVPQPYAGYVVAGWLPNICLPAECFIEDDLVIVADSRRTLPVRYPGGMYSPPDERKLIEPTGVALGVVSMAGTQEPEETELGVPYMRGRYYLAVQRPRIFQHFPHHVVSSEGRAMPIDLPDHFVEGRELIKYELWRQFTDNQNAPTAGGPTVPSKDGWTGD